MPRCVLCDAMWEGDPWGWKKKISKTEGGRGDEGSANCSMCISLRVWDSRTRASERMKGDPFVIRWVLRGDDIKKGKIKVTKANIPLRNIFLVLPVSWEKHKKCTHHPQYFSSKVGFTIKHTYHDSRLMCVELYQKKKENRRRGG